MKIGTRKLFLPVCVGAALLVAWPALPDAPAGRYTIDAATVLDNETGLMWQRDVHGSTYTWLDALSYCETLSLAGRSDWRLPTRKELHTIVDVSRHSPAIDATAFPGTPSEGFWSSTPLGGQLAWTVYFTTGQPSWTSTGNTYRVRCVR